LEHLTLPGFLDVLNRVCRSNRIHPGSPHGTAVRSKSDTSDYGTPISAVAR
jgi:hypothetical protein